MNFRSTLPEVPHNTTDTFALPADVLACGILHGDLIIFDVHAGVGSGKDTGDILPIPVDATVELIVVVLLPAEDRFAC